MKVWASPLADLKLFGKNELVLFSREGSRLGFTGVCCRLFWLWSARMELNRGGGGLVGKVLELVCTQEVQ